MYGQICGSICLMHQNERLTKRQATSRPDHLWPELWTKLGRNAKLREKQKWAIEKPKLDNARQLRRIFLIEPDDEELKHTMKNARGQGDGVPKACEQQAPADSCGPEAACVQTPSMESGTRRGGRAN